MSDNTKDSKQESARPFHRPDRNYTPVDNRLIDYWWDIIGTDAAALYVILDRLHNTEYGCAYPSRKWLERKMGRTGRTVQKARKTLEDHGLLIVHAGGKGQTNQYILQPLTIPKSLSVQNNTTTKTKEGSDQFIGVQNNTEGGVQNDTTTKTNNIKTNSLPNNNNKYNGDLLDGDSRNSVVADKNGEFSTDSQEDLDMRDDETPSGYINRIWPINREFGIAMWTSAIVGKAKEHGETMKTNPLEHSLGTIIHEIDQHMIESEGTGIDPYKFHECIDNLLGAMDKGYATKKIVRNPGGWLREHSRRQFGMTNDE